jgi:hypothetical protein
MSDVYQLYPHQQPQTNNLLANPGQAINALAGLTLLQAEQMQVQGRQAVGQIYSNNINPDGTLNTQGFLSGVANSPAAARVPELASSVLAQEGQIIANSSNQLALYGQQNEAVAKFLGSLDPRTATPDTVNSGLTTLGLTEPTIPATTLYGWNHLIQDDPQGLAHGIETVQAIAAGPTALATRVPGPPTPAGAPQQTSMGGAIYGGGTFPVEPPPGFAERQIGGAKLDVALAGSLADAAEGSPARRAILGNLQSSLQNFTSGPGADWSLVAKAFVNRNVPLPAGWQFDPKSIQSQEEFNKQAFQLAQAQFQTIGGTGTDAKFSSAFATSPKETLSQLGNQGIIRLLQGNEDAIQAKNTSWLGASQSNPALSYRQFSQAFNTHFDPRVFQLKYIPQAQRNTYVAGLDPVDRARFLQNMAFAYKQGWVNFGAQ